MQKVAATRCFRRPVCAAGQPVCPQVRRRIRLSASDRKFPPLTGRSGTQHGHVACSRAPRLAARCPGPRRHPASYTLRGCSHVLLAGSKSAPASRSQFAAGGDRWLTGACDSNAWAVSSAKLLEPLFVTQHPRDPPDPRSTGVLLDLCHDSCHTSWHDNNSRRTNNERSRRSPDRAERAPGGGARSSCCGLVMGSDLRRPRWCPQRRDPAPQFLRREVARPARHKLGGIGPSRYRVSTLLSRGNSPAISCVSGNSSAVPGVCHRRTKSHWEPAHRPGSRPER
jgi:hypothetical protein